MKTYVLMVSRLFPANHKRKGEETYFPQKIKTAIEQAEEIEETGACFPGRWDFEPKQHTIRSNYPFWEKRIKQVQDGKAILSVRYWSGKPYNSKQVEICQLDKDLGVGIQRIYFDFKNIEQAFISYENSANGTQTYPGIDDLAKNDGLSLEDFKEWFKKADLSEPMAIIHFTKFRY